MADNSLRTPGSGETIASDDIGSVKFQRVKINVGADGAAADVQPPDADGIVSSRNMPAGGLVWNGATWDRVRGNTEGTVLVNAARTSSASSANQTNYNGRGVLVILNIAVASGTGGLQVQIVAPDPASGNLVNLTALPPAIIATGRYGYELYPGATTAGAAGNGNVQQRTAGVLPRTWLASVTAGDGSSYTYGLGYSVIL